MDIRAESLRILYRQNKIKIAGLRKAVADGNLTTANFKAITGEDY